MFSSHARLKQRTPEQGINRREYIGHLVEEYHTTTDVEAQEQVTANLANFAYDPINWQHLKDAEALELFTELLTTPNERLHLHGLAGFCNIALDATAHKYITQQDICARITPLLHSTKNADIQLNCLTLHYQLLSAEHCSNEIKRQIVTPPLLRRVAELREKSADQRIRNLATLLLEDFGKRTELHELPQHVPASSKTAL